MLNCEYLLSLRQKNFHHINPCQPPPVQKSTSCLESILSFSWFFLFVFFFFKNPFPWWPVPWMWLIAIFFWMQPKNVSFFSCPPDASEFLSSHTKSKEFFFSPNSHHHALQCPRTIYWVLGRKTSLALSLDLHEENKPMPPNNSSFASPVYR